MPTPTSEIVSPSTPRNREERRHPARLLGYQGAADYLDTTPRHIRVLWSERKLPAVKVGRLVKFDLDDLDAFIDRQRVGSVR